MRRAGLLIATALLGALHAPVGARADHTACGGPGQPVCPVFDPQLEAGPSVPYTESISALAYRVYQGDHQSPMVRAELLVPTGWQFGVTDIRPAEQPGATAGIPALTCEEALRAEADHNDQDPPRLDRAEIVAGGIGMLAHTDDTRFSSPRNRSLEPARYGFRGGSNPALFFLRWDAPTQTAHLCMVLWADDYRLDHSDDPADVCNVRSADMPSQVNNQDAEDPVCEIAREVIVPVTLRKIATGDPDAVRWSWRFTFDLARLHKNARLFERSVSMLELNFWVGGLTAGNWHVNDTSGLNEPALFSRVTATPGSYDFRARLTTCLDGIAAPSDPALCENGRELTRELSRLVDITPPPSTVVHDFGTLTGPEGAFDTPNANLGLRSFGLLRGTTTATFTWNQPLVAPTETLKGYELVIAIPGVQESRHFEYLITNHQDPAFDPRAPCGANGDAPTCTLELSFPLSTVGAAELPPDGKYDVALVTLYEGHDITVDHRSDGLCDDGTPEGVRCPPSQPRHQIVGLGVSTWQFLIQDREWPLAFVEVQEIRRTGRGPRFDAPFYVLLVDFSLKRARFVVWNPLGRADFYSATSNGIVGDNAAGVGVLSFGSTELTGHTVNWRFDGYVSPAGSDRRQTVSVPSETGLDESVRLYVQPAPWARGTFARYDLKGLPGAFPPGGMPTASVEPFEGNKL